MKFTKYGYLKSLHGVELKAADYRVLVTLLDYANRDGTMAHPGADRLAVACCMHPETVRQSLRRLCEGRFIYQTYRGGYRRGASDYSFPPRPQQSLETVLDADHNTVKNGEIPADQHSPQTGTHNADQSIDAEKPSNDDPWRAPSQRAHGARQSSTSEGNGAGLSSGSLRSPGLSKEENHREDVAASLDSSLGTPPKTIPPLLDEDEFSLCFVCHLPWPIIETEGHGPECYANISD